MLSYDCILNHHNHHISLRLSIIFDAVRENVRPASLLSHLLNNDDDDTHVCMLLALLLLVLIIINNNIMRLFISPLLLIILTCTDGMNKHTRTAISKYTRPFTQRFVFVRKWQHEVVAEVVVSLSIIQQSSLVEYTRCYDEGVYCIRARYLALCASGTIHRTNLYVCRELLSQGFD